MRKWILVVDDDPLMLRMMEEALQNPAFGVTTAQDAKQAFIQARDLKPILIISDLQMPLFGTGDKTLRELRKDPRLAHIPFIFVSGMETVKARELVPDGDPTVRLMSKPVDWTVLQKWVLELTGLAAKAP